MKKFIDTGDFVHEHAYRIAKKNGLSEEKAWRLAAKGYERYRKGLMGRSIDVMDWADTEAKKEKVQE